MDKLNQSLDSDITDGVKIISYIANDTGNQELVQCSMWHPVNIVNQQAWREIKKQIEASKESVAAGRVSCLHYYMTANQMDVSLLAGYTRQPRWLVRLHMMPFFFRLLRAGTLKKYGEIFKVSLDDLMQGELKPPVYNQKECGEQPVD